jgi:hypothetical protein
VRRRNALWPASFPRRRASPAAPSTPVRLCPKCAAAHDTRSTFCLCVIVLGGMLLMALLGVALAFSG